MMNKMRKMKNKKGFTLMEMLIVVAIIAILIAIAIPTFASSLNKARIATDEANIRSGYASVMVRVLDPDNALAAADTTVTYTLNKDSSVSTAGEATDNYTCQGNQTQTGTSIGGVAMTTGWKKGDTISYTYDNATGKVTITVG